MLPTKAVLIWQAADLHLADLVRFYSARAGFSRIDARQLLQRDSGGDPL